MNLGKSFEGFKLYLKASGYSLSTINLYLIVMDNLCNFLGNPEIENIDYHDLQKYFVYLQESYIPKRFGNNTQPLSGSSRQNHWKGVRCYWSWAKSEFGLKSRPDEKIKMPKNNPKVILPFTVDEVRALLKVAEYTSDAKTKNRKQFHMRRRTASRDLALILLMIDTGLRVGEVSRLNIQNINLDDGQVYIEPYGDSARKTKSRIVYLGNKSRKAIWHYLANNRKKYQADEPLFISEKSERLSPNAIRCLFSDLGKRAGIGRCHPHRTRHYFCVEYLRSGGDLVTLQRQTGHSSYKMLTHYLNLASVDVAMVHRKASPGDKV